MDPKHAGHRGDSGRRAARTGARTPALLALVASVGCGSDGATSDAGVDAEVIGSLTNQGSTQMEDVRVAEGGIANFITDTLLTEARTLTGDTIDVALLQGGAIRGGTHSGPPDYAWSSETARIGNVYGPGPITRADVEGWLPFDHVTTRVTLTGAQLRRVLEHGVNRFADDAQTSFGADLELGDSGGELLHPAGLSYAVTCPGTTRLRTGPIGCDPTLGQCQYLNAAAANTVTRIVVGATVIYDAGAGGWQGDGQNARFRVVTSGFLTNGGDGHLDLRDGTNRVDIPSSQWNLPAALVERFRQMSPVTLPSDEDRITVVGEVRGLPCNLPASCTPSHRAAHPNCAHLR